MIVDDAYLWDVERGVRLNDLGSGVASFATLDGRRVITKSESFAYIRVTRDPATGEERRVHVDPSFRIYDMNGRALGACAGNVKWFVLDTAAGHRVVTVDATGSSMLWRAL